MTTTNKKTWLIEGGNSTNGPVGFALRLKADTKEEALQIVRESYLLPEELHELTTEGVKRAQLDIYFNADALTLADVSEDEDA